MRKRLATVLAVLLAVPLGIKAQASDDATGAKTATPAIDPAADKNAAKAHEILDAMVKALGGDAWLNLKNTVRQGHLAAFHRGDPDPGTLLFFDCHEWPERDRFEFGKHHDVYQFYLGRKGVEITYRGLKALPKEQVDEFLRRRDHSIETAVKIWMKDPKTIFVYEGQRMAERHMADQVTLISPENEAITIQTDVQTHLPLSRSFQWRDPVYKDKNTDIEEYADYHDVQGLPTAYSITRLHNDEMARQIFIDKVQYNENLPTDFWDVNGIAKRVKK